MKLLTIQDLAVRWQVSDKTVGRWRRRWPRLLRAVKTSARSVRWRLAVVEKFERSREFILRTPPRRSKAPDPKQLLLRIR